MGPLFYLFVFVIGKSSDVVGSFSVEGVDWRWGNRGKRGEKRDGFLMVKKVGGDWLHIQAPVIVQMYG